MCGDKVYDINLAGFRINLNLNPVGRESVGFRDVTLGCFGVHHLGVGFIKSVGDNHFTAFPALEVASSQDGVDGCCVIGTFRIIFEKNPAQVNGEVGGITQQRQKIIGKILIFAVLFTNLIFHEGRGKFKNFRFRFAGTEDGSFAGEKHLAAGVGADIPRADSGIVADYGDVIRHNADDLSDCLGD